jgi:hypothetical protein
LGDSQQDCEEDIPCDPHCDPMYWQQSFAPALMICCGTKHESAGVKRRIKEANTMPLLTPDLMKTVYPMVVLLSTGNRRQHSQLPFLEDSATV